MSTYDPGTVLSTSSVLLYTLNDAITISTREEVNSRRRKTLKHSSDLTPQVTQLRIWSQMAWVQLSDLWVCVLQFPIWKIEEIVGPSLWIVVKIQHEWFM